MQKCRAARVVPFTHKISKNAAQDRQMGRQVAQNCERVEDFNDVCAVFPKVIADTLINSCMLPLARLPLISQFTNLFLNPSNGFTRTQIISSFLKSKMLAKTHWGDIFTLWMLSKCNYLAHSMHLGKLSLFKSELTLWFPAKGNYVNLRPRNHTAS